MAHGLNSKHAIMSCEDIWRLRDCALEQQDKIERLHTDNYELEKERDRYAKSIKIRDMIGKWGEVAGQAWAAVQLVVTLFFAVFAIAAGAYLGIQIAEWIMVHILDQEPSLKELNR